MQCAEIILDAQTKKPRQCEMKATRWKPYCTRHRNCRKRQAEFCSKALGLTKNN